MKDTKLMQAIDNITNHDERMEVIDALLEYNRGLLESLQKGNDYEVIKEVKNYDKN